MQSKFNLRSPQRVNPGLSQNNFFTALIEFEHWMPENVFPLRMQTPCAEECVFNVDLIKNILDYFPKSTRPTSATVLLLPTQRGTFPPLPSHIISGLNHWVTTDLTLCGGDLMLGPSFPLTRLNLINSGLHYLIESRSRWCTDILPDSSLCSRATLQKLSQCWLNSQGKQGQKMMEKYQRSL